MGTIDEAIADAMAEEEVKQNMGQPTTPAIQLVPPLEENKVTIDLEEYKELILQASDYERLLNEINDCVRLNYNEDDIEVIPNLTKFYKIFFPETCKAMLRSLIIKKQGNVKA